MNPDHDWPADDPGPRVSTVDVLPPWVADALDAGSAQDWYDVDDDRERRNAVWSVFVRDVEAALELEPEDGRRVLRLARLAMRGQLDAGEP